MELDGLAQLREHSQDEHLPLLDFVRVVGAHELRQFSEHLPDPPRALSLEPGLLLPRGRLSAGFGLHLPVDFGDDSVDALILLEHLLVVALALALALGAHELGQSLEHFLDPPSVLVLEVLLGQLEEGDVLGVLLKSPPVVQLGLGLQVPRLEQLLGLTGQLAAAHDRVVGREFEIYCTPVTLYKQ